MLDTFKEEVFDYEAMLTTVTDEDFKDNIIDGIRSAARTAAVTLTNEAIGALTEHFDLQLEAEEKQAEGHVIDTQAIAGAGAREVGVAGSVAITVLNAETRATIADGAKIEASGDMTMEASELRAVHNTASAAVDSKGNASANKGRRGRCQRRRGRRQHRLHREGRARHAQSGRGRRGQHPPGRHGGRQAENLH